MSWSQTVGLLALAWLCLLAYTRIGSIIEKSVLEGDSNANLAIADVGRRRLDDAASARQVNPFMDSTCLDFIQDSSLQISVSHMSVVIVARNEEPSALIKTVRFVTFCEFAVVR